MHVRHLERRTHAILTLALQRTLVVLCLPSCKLLLLLIFGALSRDLVLLVLLLVLLRLLVLLLVLLQLLLLLVLVLLVTELVALAALFGDLAPVLLELPVLSLLSCAQLLLPESVGLFFLGLPLDSLLLENSFANETRLFLSAYLFVETDLLLSFPLEPFFLEPLLFKESLILKALLFLPFLALLLECLLFLPLRLRLGSLSSL